MIIQEEILKDWQLNVGASEDAIRISIAKLGCSLPPDYVQFFREHDGGEGFVGDNYLILWSVEDLAPFNHEYEVEQYAPGILLFGSNGGGEGYGFDMNDTEMSIVRIPFIGMDRLYAIPVARSFSGLFSNLQ